MGVHKAVSAARACRALNSSIQVETHLEALTPANAGARAMRRAGPGTRQGQLQQRAMPGVCAAGVTQQAGAARLAGQLLPTPVGHPPLCAVQLVRQYDVILDASDNAPTRYLIRCGALAWQGNVALRAALPGKEVLKEMACTEQNVPAR